MKEPIWIEKFKIRSYEVDIHGEISSSSILNLFQEAAGNHATNLRVGYRHLRPDNKAWVLSRIDIKIFTAPKWGDEIEIKTWPSSYDKIFAIRDFEFISDGTIVIEGRSAWILMDTETRRLSGVADVVSSLPHSPEISPHLPKMSKLTGFDEILENSNREYKILFSDLDTNEHVNNSKYLQWLLDSYPHKFLKDHLLNRIRLNYLSEASSGELLSIYTDEIAENVKTISHLITSGEDRRKICTAILDWENRQWDN